jgi:CSLREA domain-containing protein
MRKAWRGAALVATIALGVVLPAAAGAAQFTVNSTADASDLTTVDNVCVAGPPAAGACTLRAAIQQANALFGAHTIIVPAGTYAPSTALPALAVPVAIEGPAGARATVVSGPAGQDVLRVNSSSVSVHGLTLAGGGRGIYVQSGSNVVIDQVAVRDNTTTGQYGAGILVGASTKVLLTRSSITGNSVEASGDALGGGVYVWPGAELTAVATTIAGNLAKTGGNGFGGGVAIAPTASAVLRHVTLADNRVQAGSLATHGGNVSNGGQLTIEDSVLTGGQAHFGANCYGAVVKGGRNIDSGTTCAFGPGHLNGVDPQLLPLADYGGPTGSRTLATTSPARDAALACPAGGLDQRGAAAPSGSDCDIGAVELSADLGVTVQAAQAGAAPGADVTYLVRVANAGMDAAPGTVLEVTTGGATPTLASPSTGTCTLQVRCEIGTLARGQDVTVTVVARAGTSPIAFSAGARSGLPDPAPANDTATLTTPVTGASAPPPTGSEPPPVTTSPPALGRLRLVGRARTARVTRVATTLSVPATVAITVDRLLPGRRVSGRCRAGARTGTRCTLARRVGAVRLRAARGAVTLRIPARIRGRVLAPGRYRFRAVAADAAGRRSTARLLTVQVTR